MDSNVIYGNSEVKISVTIPINSFEFVFCVELVMNPSKFMFYSHMHTMYELLLLLLVSFLLFILVPVFFSWLFSSQHFACIFSSFHVPLVVLTQFSFSLLDFFAIVFASHHLQRKNDKAQNKVGTENGPKRRRRKTKEKNNSNRATTHIFHIS